MTIFGNNVPAGLDAALWKLVAAKHGNMRVVVVGVYLYRHVEL